MDIPCGEEFNGIPAGRPLEVDCDQTDRDDRSSTASSGTPSLAIAFSRKLPLPLYGVTYQPDHRQLATVAEEQRFATPYQSPQLALWEPQANEWLTVIRIAAYAPRRPPPVLERRHLRLFPDCIDTLVKG
jgi:hypothetical protein